VWYDGFMADTEAAEKIDVSAYAGEWVALLEGRVVAHHATLDGLMEDVREQGVEEEASVFLVPRKDEGPYVLWVI
jgi:hypothetical protein